MIDIYFITNWSKKGKQFTWSGTNWGIFNALKNYFIVHDIDVSQNDPFFTRLKRKIGIPVKADMHNARIKKQRKKVLKILPKKCQIAFQFSDIVLDDLGYKTFIYQDLSTDYVEYMYRELPEIFKVSAYQHLTHDVIKIRQEQQNKYFDNCAGVLTMGQWFKKDIIERTGVDPSKVCHSGGGINLDASKIDYSKKAGTRILFVGRDYIRKGLAITIEAFKILKEKNPKVEIFVAGPEIDPYVNENIDGYYYCGDCNHDKLADLFNLCDVFCMPSYFEAYGLVFIEALTYGLPCIGRNCYEMPYFIEEGVTGYLIKEDNANDLANKMQIALNNKDMQLEVRSRKDYYIQEYSWDAVAKRMSDFIHSKI